MLELLFRVKKSCLNCTKDLICKDGDKLINQTKVYASNLKETKRKPPNSFGYMLPWSREN